MAKLGYDRISDIAKSGFRKNTANDTMASVTYPRNPVDAARGLLVGAGLGMALWFVVFSIL